MWNLDFPKIAAALGESMPFARVAVETGTCRGSTAKVLARHFERVYTIELSQSLFQASRARFAAENLDSIQALQGNSAEVLLTLVPELAGEPSLFFFLDAHWSGDTAVDWNAARWKGYGFDTAHTGKAGEIPTSGQQCPLKEEFRAIATLYPGRALILVDDTKNLPSEGPGKQNLEFPGEDWSHLSRDLLRAELGERLEREIDLEQPSQWLVVLKASESQAGK